MTLRFRGDGAFEAMSERKRIVVVVGTLDTKGREVAYVARRIRAAGVGTLVVDSGILGDPAAIEPDVGHEEVAKAAGTTLSALRMLGARGAAVEVMAQGLRRVVGDLYRAGRLNAILALGGAEGAIMAAEAMQAVPVGVPKLIVTPVAAGQRVFAPFVGLRDVLVMHSVVDILGVNPISRPIYDNAARAIVGMVRGPAAPPKVAAGDRAVALTMLGNTTPAVMRLERALEVRRYTPVIFHANGVGGRCMEEFIAAGVFVGVLDFTASEVVDELVGGLHAGGPHRMAGAARQGVPQVVVPGCVDFFVAGPVASVPEKWRTRPLYRHNPALTLVRATRDEMAEVARVMAVKLSASRGPVAVAVPLGGLSIPNRPGDVFHDPVADATFRAELRKHLRSDIPIVEVEAHINDAAFTEVVLALFMQVMRATTTRSRRRGPPSSAPLVTPGAE